MGMKRYTVTHDGTAEPISPLLEDMRVAHGIAASMGDDFNVTTWIGHFGLPSVAVVMRELDGHERVETICLYTAQANKLARQYNDERPGSYVVRNIVLNCQYPHGGDDL
ncbi:hypothetical protein FDH38_gp002 [Dinoroseobacter phage vB_DshS-R5C]|uniref:Uncharacterized protein n=1 Tax=Dinoroseobacter phage vB_DshS-R5C TaxID=1965368 RepID=A0A1V0DY14_9CAUD|nr:hypothetical protein FDH38_gp002 [Dinoroseobacter phage vB_DshS-R5C]ARB06056.1 hypothetical protein vBDshSR5C_2 [Dinoroseobacter phage vB_DshS-R5C]